MKSVETAVSNDRRRELLAAIVLRAQIDRCGEGAGGLWPG